MNLILFEPAELDRPLPRGDRRATHILGTLRRQPGDTMDVGVLNGPHGKATLVTITADALILEFAWGLPSPPLDALTLVVGLPRPQTARDILRDATTLGVAAIHFVRVAKAEASYAQSTLWSSGEWRRQAISGAEQAFATRIPEITHGRQLDEVLAALPNADVRLALDNYEAGAALGDFPVERGKAHVLAVGGERGWSTLERAALRAQGFTLVHLGQRVLRTETATTAALAILRAKLGWM